MIPNIHDPSILTDSDHKLTVSVQTVTDAITSADGTRTLPSRDLIVLDIDDYGNKSFVLLTPAEALALSLRLARMVEGVCELMETQAEEDK